MITWHKPWFSKQIEMEAIIRKAVNDHSTLNELDAIWTNLYHTRWFKRWKVQFRASYLFGRENATYWTIRLWIDRRLISPIFSENSPKHFFRGVFFALPFNYSLFRKIPIGIFQNLLEYLFETYSSKFLIWLFIAFGGRQILLFYFIVYYPCWCTKRSSMKSILKRGYKTKCHFI